MKKLYKYLTVVLAAGGLLTACETTEMELLVSPNDLAADQADPDLLLNSIQLAYVSNMHEISNVGAEVTRIDYMFGRNYFNNYPGQTFSNAWARTYSSEFNIPGSPVDVGIYSNVSTLEAIDQESDVDYSFHIAVGETLKAHMLLLLVDYLGEAVFTQANMADEFPAPMLDDGATVYEGALGLLDKAEALFAADPPVLSTTNDFFYGGDSEQWLKLVNTIRLKAYVTTGNSAAFNAIIASGEYIDTEADDFEFNYGSSALQPDTRHPDYADDYTPSGANIYQSNWLMETMLEREDPRIRYYFYRQSGETPGAGLTPPNEETLACSLANPPQHYVDGGFTYCSVADGYWGRSHGNNEGTPPDNFLRTAVGVYPAGGKFDDNGFDEDLDGDGEPDGDGVGLGAGAGGAGIHPIILSSYVEFWKGRMAASDAEKAEFLRAGLEESIAKVTSFGSLDPNADLSFEPTEEEITAYIDGVVADFNAAAGDDKMNIFAEQYFITLFGGAQDAYNYYRQTGFPTTLLPNWEANPGPFPRSFLYPQNEVITNPNLTQKTDLTQQVFWDNNPASPAFPPAN